MHSYSFKTLKGPKDQRQREACWCGQKCLGVWDEGTCLMRLKYYVGTHTCSELINKKYLLFEMFFFIGNHIQRTKKEYGMFQYMLQ